MIDYDADSTPVIEPESTREEQQPISPPGASTEASEEVVDTSVQPNPVKFSGKRADKLLRGKLRFIIPSIAVVILAVALFYGYLKPNYETQIEPSALSGNGLSEEDKLLATVKQYIELNGPFNIVVEREDMRDAADQFMTGLDYYASGDPGAAEGWFLVAAEQEYVPAQSMLCLLYDGDADKEQELYSWSERAYNNNDAIGYYMLGKCYFNAVTVKRNYNQAKKLLECVVNGQSLTGEILKEPLAAYGGATVKPLAQYFLGEIYLYGLVSETDKDYEYALELYSR